MHFFNFVANRISLVYCIIYQAVFNCVDISIDSLRSHLPSLEQTLQRHFICPPYAVLKQMRELGNDALIKSCPSKFRKGTIVLNFFRGWPGWVTDRLKLSNRTVAGRQFLSTGARVFCTADRIPVKTEWPPGTKASLYHRASRY